MTTNYAGQSANITAPSPVAIASSTDASPIHVVFSAPHNMLDGTEADFTGHAVNIAVNGVHRIGYVSATEVTLIGSSGSGAGAGGATGQGLSLVLGAYALVDGSVPPVAGAFNTPTEFQADSIAFLTQAIGVYKEAYILNDGATDDTGAVYATFTGTVDNTYVQAAVPWSVFTGSGTDAPLHNGDILDIEADINYTYQAASSIITTVFSAALFALLAEPGVAFSALTRIPTSAREAQAEHSTGDFVVGSLHLSGQLAITGHGQKFQITIQVKPALVATFNPSGQIQFTGDWRIRARVLRPTGVPQ